MRVTWLGWAGAEVEAAGETLVIDPLADQRAVFAAVVPDAGALAIPDVVPAQDGRAVAGLLTHLHRDHADAGALSSALAPGAPVFEPGGAGGEPLENLALRAEYRHDWSSEKVFLGGSGSSPSADEQDTIALELNIQF